MANYDEKPNGGSLSIEARIGKKVFEPVARKNPDAETFANADDDSYPRQSLEDAIDAGELPADIDDEFVERCYLVELRLGWLTYEKADGATPYMQAYYARGDNRGYHRRNYEIDATEDGDFVFPDDLTIYRSVVTDRGNPNPVSVFGVSKQKIRREYRAVLKNAHGIDAQASSAGNVDGSQGVRS
ncbi:hypothetical protein ACFFQF_01015 [Haladaptatus pallidirubidus]|uniref:Tail assembly chaperone n=1 Tax=Haladaptatus pallidirubidus TaxID=1008152 RepID=A0AAV3UBK9_9EURY|nr:hypothetical protein [Haladaptatus pallidirubidus]